MNDDGGGEAYEVGECLLCLFYIQRKCRSMHVSLCLLGIVMREEESTFVACAFGMNLEGQCCATMESLNLSALPTTLSLRSSLGTET